MSEVVINGIKIELPEWLLGTRIESKLRDGSYEMDEAHAARQRIKPGMKVLEVGAGLGYVSSVCASCAGAENLLSLEANPKMVPIVRQTLDRNGHASAALEHAALVASKSAVSDVPFHAGTLFWGGSVVSEDAGEKDTVSVPGVSLDAVLGLFQPDFIMLDVEGTEVSYFDDPLPKHVRFVVMELHPKQYGSKGIKRIVDGLSKSGMTYDPVTSSHRLLGFMRA